MDEQACGQKFACKCLNVRLSARKTEQRPPNLEYEKDFEPFFVGTDGITVVRVAKLDIVHDHELHFFGRLIHPLPSEFALV